MFALAYIRGHLLLYYQLYNNLNIISKGERSVVEGSPLWHEEKYVSDIYNKIYYVLYCNDPFKIEKESKPHPQ